MVFELDIGVLKWIVNLNKVVFLKGLGVDENENFRVIYYRDLVSFFWFDIFDILVLVRYRMLFLLVFLWKGWVIENSFVF